MYAIRSYYDAASKQTYKDWLERNKGSDRISGAKSADMKAAVVDAFRGDDKSILIATESGAEGINLQFCSLIINTKDGRLGNIQKQPQPLFLNM